MDKCTGDCMQCSIIQRQYCSSQLCYNNMRMMERVSERLEEMLEILRGIRDRSDRERNGVLINPVE